MRRSHAEYAWDCPGRTVSTRQVPCSVSTDIEPVPIRQRGSIDVEIAPELGADGKPTAGGWRWIGRKLRDKMPTRTARKPGGARDYITARQVQQRLDDIVGPGNWSTNQRVIRADHPVAIAVGLAIYGVWKWDVGYSNNPDAVDEWLEDTDEQSGEVKTSRNRAYEDEPLKAAFSDGLKRARHSQTQQRCGLWPDA